MIHESDVKKEKFLVPVDITELEHLQYLKGSLDHTMLKRSLVTLITNDGSGASHIIDQFKREFERQVQVVDCVGKSFIDVLAEIMLGFGFGHKTLNYYDTNPFDVTEGLLYYLHEKNFRPMLVFTSFHALRLPEMEHGIPLISKLVGKAGIVLHVTPEHAVKLSNHRRSIIKNMFQKALICEIRDLEIAELEKICLDAGIINLKVIVELTKYKPSVEVLLHNLDKIRAELRDKLK